MKYDLHTHSTASDGILSPEALVSRAKLHGVTHLALTDHDTIDGLQCAKQAALQEGIQVIAGIELSSQWSGKNIHIVGLNIDCESPALQESVAFQQQARASRGVEIAARLAKLGIPGTLEGAKKYAGKATIGRPHFARYLVELGLVPSVAAAFKKYLGNGKAGDVKQVWPTVPEVCAVINRSGGIAVLAHPLRYEMTMTKLRALIDEFVHAGGRGIEVLSGVQNVNQTQSVLALATRFKLLASCGSDFHVPDQPWQELGCFGKLPENCTPVWHAW